MQDTIIIKGIDSSYAAKKNNLILIYNQKGQQEITDTPIIISTITAVFVAFITTYITYLFNKRKNNYEIDKLKEETLNLKKTFQPIVIGTIQSIQDKIITNKIDALKSLVAIRNKFWYHEQQYHEGEPMTPDYDDYLELLFYGFSNEQYNQYDKFHNAYSYLFPDNVFKVLTDLKKALSSLNEAKKSYDSMDDPEINLHKDDKKQIESTISLFSNAIELIRKDCHLDTSFIHEFIEENKK